MTKLPFDESATPSQLILYQTKDGRTRLEVRMDKDTVWLSQNQMAELFQTTKQNVSLHVNNIFAEGELERAATVKEFLTVQQEGKRQVSRNVEHYNLDVIISVGYRVKSLRGTQFRIWATQRLREYIVKGFTLDDERLKQVGGGGYFDELLARIRDIRSSEKLFYKKILEIYATNLIVSAYLDFAELQALNRHLMYMRDWIARLDDFLKLSERDILTHAGRFSHEQAQQQADAELEEYRKQTASGPSPVERDFEEAVEKIKKLAGGRKTKKLPRKK